MDDALIADVSAVCGAKPIVDPQPVGRREVGNEWQS